MRHVFGDCACPAVAVTLDKRLPVASGIGGGSSDAAAALRVLARHWDVKGSAALFRSLARTLGADVPMCLAARPLLASGVGDVLEPVEGMPALHLVLVNPGTPLSTPDVFRTLVRRDNPPLPPLPARLDAESLHGWLAGTRNDLEVPAQSLVPDIAEALSALGSAGAAVARMSGSGATCFGLFSTGAAAARAAASIGATRPGWFCVATETLRQETGQ